MSVQLNLRVTGTVSSVVLFDPLVPLWRRRNELTRQAVDHGAEADTCLSATRCGHPAGRIRHNELVAKQSQLLKASHQLEVQMSQTAAVSIAGLVAQARLIDETLRLMRSDLAGIGNAIVEGLRKLEARNG